MGSFHNWDITPELPDLSIPEEERQYLATDKLLETKPNQQVINIHPSRKANPTGVSFQAITDRDPNEPGAKIVPVTLYLGQWHAIHFDPKVKQFYIGILLLDIHDKDIPPTPEEQSNKSDTSDTEDSQTFRNISIPQEAKTP